MVRAWITVPTYSHMMPRSQHGLCQGALNLSSKRCRCLEINTLHSLESETHRRLCSSFMLTTPSISVHHKQSTKTAYGLQHRHSPSYRSFFLSTADICCCLSPSFRRNIVSPALNLIGKATTIYKLLLFLYFYHFSSCLQMWFLARSRWLEFGSFLILSCWTECRRDAALTHSRLSRRKVVLRDSTGHG